MTNELIIAIIVIICFLLLKIVVLDSLHTKRACNKAVKQFLNAVEDTEKKHHVFIYTVELLDLPPELTERTGNAILKAASKSNCAVHIVGRGD